MTIDKQLQLKNLKVQADRIRENNRIRAEAEARKLLHSQNNIRTYTPAGMVPPSLMEQMKARKQAVGSGSPTPSTGVQGATSEAIQNAMATMRAHKGMVAPEFANETEYVPTIEEALAAQGELPEEIPVEEESATTAYTALDAARQLLAGRTGQGSNTQKGKRGFQPKE